MDTSLILKDLRTQFPKQSVLYSDDIAALLGKSVAAADALKGRGGFPLPILEVGGRPAVSIYAVADWLAGGAIPKSRAEQSKAPAPQTPKRRRESLGKYLLGLQVQRDFLGALTANIERLIIDPGCQDDRPAKGTSI